MRNKKVIYKTIILITAVVWTVNGLFCKVLNLVPRHELIVARILGVTYSSVITKAIGVAETLMACWILSGIKPRLNAIAQMVIIAIMNVIEFMLAQDLLLWGKANAFFAALFILIIYLNEFKLKATSN